MTEIRTILEILHREENGHCMECAEQKFPCRTMALLGVGERMDRMCPGMTDQDARA